MQNLLIVQAEDGLNFLQDRRDFWSQQKPDYPKGPKEETTERSTWEGVTNRVLNKKPIQPFRAENEDYVVNEFDKQPIQPFRAESEDYILNEFDR